MNRLSKLFYPLDWVFMLVFGVVSTIKHQSLMDGVNTMLLYIFIVFVVRGLLALADSISKGDWD